MSNDILSLIQSKMDGFSKGQKRIAQYILESYDKAAFLTASKLGNTVSVSESTVVRFAVELGYEGYPSMQKALQKMIRNRLTSVQRMGVARDRLGEEDLLFGVLNSDIENIRATLEEANGEAFNKAINAILSAEEIYILGVRSSAAMASFLAYYFNLIFDKVKLVQSSSTSEMFEHMIRVKKNDIVIGISFPRYTAGVVRAMRFSKDRGATNLAITDSVSSPLSSVSDITLVAKSDMISFVDSLAAPLSLINALIVAVGQRQEKDVMETFEELEDIWDEYGVYEKTK